MNRTKNKNLISDTINLLRFPLIVGVVFIHFSLSKGLNIHGTFFGLNNPSWFFFIVNFISEVLSKTCVPTFFFISGFLFFYKANFNRELYIQKIENRVRSLLIPFILWNIIAAVCIFCKSTIPFISNYYPPIEIKISFIRLFNTFFCNSNNSGILVYPPDFPPPMDICPINIPLWYIRELMIMVILSPIIYGIIKKGRVYSPIILGLFWYFSPLFLPVGCYLSMLSQALFFFSFGAFYSINKIDFADFCLKNKASICTIYIIIAIIDVLTKESTYSTYIHTFGILFGVLSAFSITSYFVEYRKTKTNQILTNSSFFIYACHTLFMNDAAKFAFKTLQVPDNNPFIMLTFYLSVPIITIGICFSLYAVLLCISPHLCRLLTGGR